MEEGEEEEEKTGHRAEKDSHCSAYLLILTHLLIYSIMCSFDDKDERQNEKRKPIFSYLTDGEKTDVLVREDAKKRRGMERRKKRIEAVIAVGLD